MQALAELVPHRTQSQVVAALSYAAVLVQVAYLPQSFMDSGGLHSVLIFSSLDTTWQSREDSSLWSC